MNNTNLNAGDTITTTANIADGFRVDNGTTVVAPGENKISTSGRFSAGLYAKGTNSVLNATNVTVTTTGANSDAVSALSSSVVTINGGTLIVSGDSSIGAYSDGATINLTNVVINSTNNNTVGVVSAGAKGVVNLDKVAISATGGAVAGVKVAGGGLMILSNGSSVTTEGAYGAWLAGVS
ncbi:hypothetical protein HED54_03815 [Ochrobactrum anthropi ATCC 49188]|nr:hypothetical protein [Brucella anthropi ATCC 49188]